MKEQYTIVIDTNGSDQGSLCTVRGAAKALKTYEQLSVVLVGDAAMLNQECERLQMPSERVEIVSAADAVTNYDSPTDAIFKKTDSSMVRALSVLSEHDDWAGMITAGNTGALLVGAMRYLSAPERVRPALAAVLPSENGSFTCLVDTGATIDCTSSMLRHFAHLGSAFMRQTYGLESPRVGLLSNGSEPTKGNRLVKETYPLLASDSELNFVGNIEGNRALSGDCDVLVCDGFAGNQVLKVSEGMATRLMTDIVRYAKRTESEEVMKLVGHLMAVYDFGSLGGGIILGCKKPVIKTRGSAGEQAIVNTAGMLLNMAQKKAVFDTESNHI